MKVAGRFDRPAEAHTLTGVFVTRGPEGNPPNAVGGGGPRRAAAIGSDDTIVGLVQKSAAFCRKASRKGGFCMH